MNEHDIHIPYRARIYDLSCGDKQIHISINGRLALVFNYDPHNNVLTQCDLPAGLYNPERKPGTDVETKVLKKE
jgi:hypothetical protein